MSCFMPCTLYRWGLAKSAGHIRDHEPYCRPVFTSIFKGSLRLLDDAEDDAYSWLESMTTELTKWTDSVTSVPVDFFFLLLQKLRFE